MKLSELTSKEIINDKDGSRIGKIIDIEFDSNGKIKNIIIGNGTRLISIFKKDYLTVEWSKILKIGSDVIIISEDYLTKTGQKEQKS